MGDATQGLAWQHGSSREAAMTSGLWRSEKNRTLTSESGDFQLVISGGHDDGGTSFHVRRISDGCPLASGWAGTVRDAMAAAERAAERFAPQRRLRR